MQLSYDSKLLTKIVHVYTSCLVGNLWNDSPSLRWGNVRRVGDKLEVTGESRRFPFAQHWELEEIEEGLAFRVWLEAFEPIEIQEYQTSVLLIPEYDRWETEHETGCYEPLTPDDTDWRHLNKDYATGRFIRAQGPDLPPVVLKNAAEDMPLHMTAVNTGCQQNARVMQALRTAEGGLPQFSPGRHSYFSGVIVVDDDAPLEERR